MKSAASLVALFLAGLTCVVVGRTGLATCENALTSIVLRSKATMRYAANSYPAPILISKLGEDIVRTRGQETKLNLLLPQIVLNFLETHPSMRPFWAILLKFNVEWKTGVI